MRVSREELIMFLEKKGFVRKRVLFNLLECLDIKLGQA